MSAQNSVLDYLNAVYRYRLVTACVCAVGVLLTLWAVRSLPNVYRSTTLIMVEPQDVPSSYVKPTVTTHLEERLNALSQEVLSRTRLQTIINDFGLFKDLRRKGVPDEDIVDMMRKHVQVEVFPRDNAFRISYEGYAPSIVQQVTARLAGMYIDENLKIREEHVSGTTDFLKSELDKMKQRLEAQDAKIQAFKQAHMGELPEQRHANIQALEGLQVQLQTISLALSSARERKLMLDKQIAAARTGVPAAPGETDAASVDPRMQLQQLEAQLAQLQARYTPEHPDVISTERQIKLLRAQLAGTSSVAAAVPLPPELSKALAESQLEIARLKTQQDTIERSIQTYQARIEESFPREEELANLTRDYAVTQKQYQALLDKKMEAQLSQSLEQRQKGERFRVLDPASLPEAPARPNRPLLTVAGVGGSVLLGIVLPILLWQLDTSFHVADELTACALPVLAVIPQADTVDVADRRRRYRLRVLGFSAAGLVLGLGAVTLYARYLF
jgi:protein tyrosine kinase modulator